MRRKGAYKRMKIKRQANTCLSYFSAVKRAYALFMKRGPPLLASPAPFE